MLDILLSSNMSQQIESRASESPTISSWIQYVKYYSRMFLGKYDFLINYVIYVNM